MILFNRKLVTPAVVILEIVTKLRTRWNITGLGWKIIARKHVAMASTAANGATTAAKTKLHGRVFYESIGSPKFVLAPMVGQSEFVCLLYRHPIMRTSNTNSR